MTNEQTARHRRTVVKSDRHHLQEFLDEKPTRVLEISEHEVINNL